MGDMIDIKCNNCGNIIKQLYYGGGYFGQENHFYYCPKCFRIKEYSTCEFENELFNLPTELPPIKKCGYCKVKRKPFELKFSETAPEIKGPAGFHCPDCGSKDLTYEDVGCWD